jgi:predicted amidohydrolase YtcJ
MEVAVNDTRPDMNVWQLDPAERVSIEEAMDIMTINGARQLMCETERGSIETGKYADFLLINKDVTSCDPDKIHEGEVESVYFEGKEVYTK